MVFLYSKTKGETNIMKKIMKRLLAAILAFATVVTTLPATHVMLRILFIPQQKGKQGRLLGLTMVV